MVSPLLLAALAACGPAPRTQPAPADGPAPLADLALLSRISLDLRGVRPSAAELDAVAADPAALDTLAADFLYDPRFGERILSIYADIYLTRPESFVVDANGDAAFLDPFTKQAFIRSVGEEPLRLLARIATDDLPYTTVVTADWTIADDALIAAFPLEAIEEGTGWRKARYTDERPAAGILATNGLWWRYTTTLVNANRGRAEMVAKNLLCDNRFDHPVAFGGSGGASFEDRVREDDACIACHATLDPLGAFLYGFFRMHPESYSEATRYYPERETLWDAFSVAPAYYGAPAEALPGLAGLIAADPRFPNCAVEQGFRAVMGRSPGVADTTALTAARAAFLDGGVTLRALYGALVADPRYRSADPDWPGTVGPKRMSPDQLAASIEALTGFRWVYEGLDMLSTDTYGVRVLAGGADGVVVTQPATSHSTSSALVTAWLAEAAARHAVAADLAAAPDERTLFVFAPPNAIPAPAAQRAQLQHLVRLAHGRDLRADDPDLAALAALWDDVNADTGDPDTAWAAVLAGLLRHPDFLHY